MSSFGTTEFFQCVVSGGAGKLQIDNTEEQLNLSPLCVLSSAAGHICFSSISVLLISHTFYSVYRGEERRGVKRGEEAEGERGS